MNDDAKRTVVVQIILYCKLSAGTQFTDKMTITSGGPGISLLIYFLCTVAGELLTPPYIKPSKKVPCNLFIILNTKYSVG